ncbi:MAG: hypothetical protein U9P63_02585 [Patescibacteria group bacterium]|nr:hypothetical protein [Patescibacteria group bacterium]
MNKQQLEQLKEFFHKGEKGEPVLFYTPNGIFLSPEAGQDLIDKKLKAQRKEIVGMIEKKTDLKKIQKYLNNPNNVEGLNKYTQRAIEIGYNKALLEIIKTLKQTK